MVKFNIAGGAYQHASQATNYQRSLNMYPSNPGPEGRGQGTMLQRAGKLELTTLPAVSEIRGMLSVDGVLYVVADNQFFSVVIDPSDLSTVVTSHGTINDYENPVSMAANTNQIIVVNGTTSGWIYSPLTFVSVTLGPIGGTGGDTYNLTINGTAIYTAQNVATALTRAQLITQINTLTGTTGVTAAAGDTGIITLTNDDNTDITVAESGTGFTAGTDGLTVTGGPLASGTATAFTQITDTNFLGGSSVAFLDGYFFLAVPDSNEFYASAINDGLTYDGLDIATAEINNSPIVKLAVKNRQLWIFKTDYIEVWYDAANASGMPLSPRTGSELSIGCSAANSVVSIDNTLYWFDSRKFVVGAVSSQSVTEQTTGNVAQTVSTDALQNTFSNYTTVDDAIGIGYQERGHLMYQLTFPTEGASWVYDLTTQMWHERSKFDPVFAEHVNDDAYFAAVVGQLLIVSGAQGGGTLYISHPQYYDDDGSPIQCIRVASHINQDFKLIGIDQLEIKLNTGGAPITGTGSDPYMSLRYSNDDGHTWSHDMQESMGQTGQYGKRISWNRLGTAQSWLFEFLIVAPFNWAIVDCNLAISEVEVY